MPAQSRFHSNNPTAATSPSSVTMDIYLLRDGKELGPFTEEATQSFLQQGVLVMDDLAWTPGLPAWSPLQQVLAPAPEPNAAAVPEWEPEIEDEVPVMTALAEPAEEIEDDVIAIKEPVAPIYDTATKQERATAKQKAFLTYLGIRFPGDASKEHAAILVTEAMEDPKAGARISQWNDDRLRLHPDIFAEEAQVKKEARADRYFDTCHREGAEYFDGVTKAHCQVLVAFLDLNYPSWEANEAEAARRYFFPAVAEKFPKTVRRQWRDHFKFPNGHGVTAEVKKSAPVVRSNGLPHRSAPSPLGALIRGAVFGLGLLLVLYVAVEMFSGEGAEEKSTATAVAPLAPTPATKPTEPAPTPKPETAADPGPSKQVTIQKAMQVKLRAGTITIEAGTKLKLLSRNGVEAIVAYGDESVAVPLEATDIGVATPE